MGKIQPAKWGIFNGRDTLSDNGDYRQQRYGMEARPLLRLRTGLVTKRMKKRTAYLPGVNHNRVHWLRFLVDAPQQ